MIAIYANEKGVPCLVVDVHVAKQEGFVENGHWEIKFLDKDCKVGVCKQYPDNGKFYFHSNNVNGGDYNEIIANAIANYKKGGEDGILPA